MTCMPSSIEEAAASDKCHDHFFDTPIQISNQTIASGLGDYDSFPPLKLVDRYEQVQIPLYWNLQCTVVDSR